MDEKKKIAKQAALAFATVNSLAGQLFAVNETQSVEERAANLLNPDVGFGPYAYIVAGDPLGWGNGLAMTTILCEQKGGNNDCYPPMDYWDSYTIALAAAHKMGSYYIEWVNAAVAVVFPG